VEADERIRATPGGSGEIVADPASGRPVPASDAPRDVAHERCIHHPVKAAIERCSACGEPICLVCAVPVRGRVIGPECLADELGDPALRAPLDPEPAVAGSWLAVAGAVLAVASTIGPWTRAGAGDRLLGAWVPSLRWSMVAAVAAVALLPATWWFRSRRSLTGAGVVILGGAAVVAAAALAIAFPPTFQAASWWPWLAAIGGVVSMAGAIASGIMERRPGQGV
jgi:hypothetical protein